jgi:hypothetical protein
MTNRKCVCVCVWACVRVGWCHEREETGKSVRERNGQTEGGGRECHTETDRHRETG